MDPNRTLFRTIIHRNDDMTFSCATPTRNLTIPLHVGGKDLRVIMARAGHSDMVADDLIARQRVIIFDDNKRYFNSQPLNGIMCRAFDSPMIGHHDHEMIRLAAIAFVIWLIGGSDHNNNNNGSNNGTDSNGIISEQLRLQPSLQKWPLPSLLTLKRITMAIVSLVILDYFI
jgi:hypothetical protein